MSYLGSWKIDDLLTFYAVTQVFATGVATDADAVPAYRVYEDETTTPLLTGTMALLDSANTAGLYSEQITLSAANGFEKGKSYAIHIAATVSSVAGAKVDSFQIEAEVDANRQNYTLIDGTLSTTYNFSGTTVKTATDVETDTQDIQARLPAALTAGGNIKADALALSGDTVAADNAESFFDGTGYAGTNNVIPSVTTVTGNVNGSVGSVTGAVGSVTGAVGSVSAGGITASSIAADAIGASELAADAVAEIADAIWDEARAGHVAAGSFGEGVASVQGNVTGSVASVTGAVGSVTGAVGSVTGNVGGNVVGSVGSVVGAVGSVTGAVGSVTGSIGSLGAQAKLDVNAEVDDVVTTDTSAELAAVPAAVSGIRARIAWLFALASNEIRQTSTLQTLRNRADSATIATAAVSDDGVTATRDSFV